jgi:xanthine dehydrogenase iron-sulfur cluster and FAD-binding subunit A
MWDKYFIANSISEAIIILNKNPENSKIINGGTDLLLEIERGIHPEVNVLVDISRIKDMDKIILDEQGYIHIGPLVTHNHCVKSKIIRESATCLAQACARIGSPQIRNRGTIAGNMITASPANDTIPALMVLDATIVAASTKGTREISIMKFFKGVRKTVLERGEIVIDIYFKKITGNSKTFFYKHALRRAQAISLLNTAVLISISKNLISEARIAIGAMAPTVIRTKNAEKFLEGKELTNETIEQASNIAADETQPISDIRASSTYRKKVVAVAVKRALKFAISKSENESEKIPNITLWGNKDSTFRSIERSGEVIDKNSLISLKINDKEYRIKNFADETLLNLIRNGAGLTGTKEGCAEGECGACTVFMDGIAVMACLVPAPRAHGTEIITIEGISSPKKLHPVQNAFIEEGAVQCGYCTPGFIMSAVKLLEEKGNPTKDEIKVAISGNLCRCTGYYKIISAIEKAVERV